MITLSKFYTFFQLFLRSKITVLEFRILIRTIAIRKIHPLYELCLKKMDPLLDFSYTKRVNNQTYIYRGKGSGSIKPHRILTRGRKKIFEKIFLNDSQDLKANELFYKSKSELLNKRNIIAPKCFDIIKGKIFTVFLYEYMNLKPIPSGREYETLREKSLELYRDSNDRDFSDPLTFEFFEFGINRLSSNKVFSPLEQTQINQLIKLSPVYFQHLDLSENNVYQDNIIIDWDGSGYFPLGMDFGRLLLSYFIFHEDVFYQSYEEKINDYYQHLHHDIAYEDFKNLTMYFFIVYFYANTTCSESIKLIQPFVKDFKNQLKAIRINTHQKEV